MHRWIAQNINRTVTVVSPSKQSLRRGLDAVYLRNWPQGTEVRGWGEGKKQGGKVSMRIRFQLGICSSVLLGTLRSCVEQAQNYPHIRQRREVLTLQFPPPVHQTVPHGMVSPSYIQRASVSSVPHSRVRETLGRKWAILHAAKVRGDRPRVHEAGCHSSSYSSWAKRKSRIHTGLYKEQEMLRLKKQGLE